MIWISVKDRLPEKSGKYRVRTIEGSIAPRVGECWVFGKITHDGFRFLEGDWQRVTHWAEEAQINNPCGHTGFESNVCEICGYPDPSRTIASLKQQVEDMKCCGNCKSFLRENCPKKEQIDEFQTEFPEPNSVCDSWAFNGKKRGEK